MSQSFSVRDVSTPGNGHRVLEVTVVRADADDLAVRVILDADPGQRGSGGRSSEMRLAAALAAEVAEQVAGPPAAAVIEISVPECPGPPKVRCFPAVSHAR
jgi:hypothetical protein